MFGVKSVICSLQVSVLSIFKPRNLVLVVLLIRELKFTICVCISCLWVVKNCMK